MAPTPPPVIGSRVLSMEDFKLTWNSNAIMTPAERHTKRLLDGFGAYCRRIGKNLLKTSKTGKRSTPGNPPFSVTGILKDFTFFATEGDEVVIGPAKTNQIFFDRDHQPVKGTVPEVLERGGEITLFEVFKMGRWKRADLRSRRRLAGLPTRYRTVKIEARPWMQVAFERTMKKKLPALIEGGIMRGV